MAGNDRDDPLAYGEYHEGGQAGFEGDGQEGERGIVGDTYRKYRDRYQQSQSGGTSGSQSSSGIAASLFNVLHGAVHDIGSEIDKRFAGRHQTTGQATQPPSSSSIGAQASTQNRYGSFARQEFGNDVKWYVDGCGYMWAVSIAIEEARESIWILDCKSNLSSLFSIQISLHVKFSRARYLYMDLCYYNSKTFSIVTKFLRSLFLGLSPLPQT